MAEPKITVVVEKITPQPKTLAPKVESVERDAKTTSLLEALSKEDELFDYNVPASFRSNATPSQLAEHLKKVYSKPAFMIENPDEIKKYVKVGDIVVRKKEFMEITAELKKGTEGEVVKYLDNGKITLSFPDNKWHWNLSLENLIYLGKKETPVKEMKVKLNEGCRVRYDGEDIREYNGEKCPAGTEGLVAAILEDKNPLLILWRYQLGLVQNVTRDENQLSHKVTINRRCSYDTVKMVRPNTVPFDKLLEKYIYGKEEQS